jgi:hypothetical protein
MNFFRSKEPIEHRKSEPIVNYTDGSVNINKLKINDVSIITSNKPTPEMIKKSQA